MNVAELLVQKIADAGITHVFAVYGSAIAGLVDAVTREPRLILITTIHEQSAGFAAEAYAKVTGKPGVAIATSGPGALNFCTPIANCFYDSVPALFITGNTSTQFRRAPDERQRAFQGCPILEVVKPITKVAIEASSGHIEQQWASLLHTAMDGRQGPVLLDIPLDVAKLGVGDDRA